MIIMPVSAYYTVAPVIDRGATIYIGEEGLNLTHALNRAGGLDGAAVESEVPTNWTIGWWVGGPISLTSPSKTLNVSTRYQNFTVAPGDFVGYTGYWYLVNPATNGTILGPDDMPRVVFLLQDPQLDIRIWDFDRDMDVTGKSVPWGDSLGFRVETNLYTALNSHYRSPLNNSMDDGYIDISVRNESAVTFIWLADNLNTPHDLLRQNVSSSPWTWGDDGNPSSPFPWATGVTDGGGRPVYPVGTYEVKAESRLNNMKENYKQGGADYTGRTVSQVCTITLVSESLSLNANRDSVARGDRFSVTLSGKPKSTYYLWVNNTGSMTGAPGDQPPTILVSAPVYQDPYEGPYTIGAHPILGAGGQTIVDDVPPSGGNVSQNEYYAEVLLAPSGTATVELRTSPDTRPGTYTIRAEDDTFSDGVSVEVEPGVLPVDAYPEYFVNAISQPAINPDIPAPVNNDLKRITRGATVFIGEEGLLNISGVLAEADAAAVPLPSPEGTVIGWWMAMVDIPFSPPQKTLDLAERETAFSVSPADFVGYTGTWYLVNPSTGMVAVDTGGSPVPVFTVQEPSLDLRIWDIDTNADVTSKSVPQGERLTFRVDTNLYSAFDSQYRPDITENTSGIIDIIVRTGGNARLNYLYQNNTTALSLLDQKVDTQPWFWGGGEASPSPREYWGTGLLDRDHYSFYPAGTYVVSAESTLNTMKENYRSAGAYYTGKTVSQAYTITLVPDQVTIEANKDTVTRGSPFAVTITGRPAGVYYLWVKDTDSLTGGPNNEPPTISLFQTGVTLDPEAGPYTIGSYQYENGTGNTLRDDVSLYPNNGVRNYARIKTSASGLRTVEFQTGPLTRNMTYTIRVENLSGIRSMSDEVTITVEPGTPVSGIGVFRPSIQKFILKNGTEKTIVPWGLGTDLPVAGDWNGDGMGDVAVYRPSIATFILKNGTGKTIVPWGLGTDMAVAGDWNGDGMGDIGVFRPSIAKFILKNGTEKTIVPWGLGTDIPVAGDWNGDGLTDVGVYRPSIAKFILKNGTEKTIVPWGLGTDTPVSGDWNGDGLTDVGVYRSSIHAFILKNGTERTVVPWGLGTDIPVTGRWS